MDVTGRCAQKRPNGAVYLFLLSLSEFVNSYGDGLGLRILRPIDFGKAEVYREYGAGFFGGEAAKSRHFLPVQLFSQAI